MLFSSHQTTAAKIDSLVTGRNLVENHTHTPGWVKEVGGFRGCLRHVNTLVKQKMRREI